MSSPALARSIMIPLLSTSCGTVQTPGEDGGSGTNNGADDFSIEVSSPQLLVRQGQSAELDITIVREIAFDPSRSSCRACPPA